MKSVIFDFDGTIADTLPLAIDCAEQTLGNLYLNDKKIERYRNMTVLQLVKELKVPVHKIPKYAVLARGYIKKHRDEIKFFKGMKETIKSLQDRGYQLYIVSSNSVENINYLLNKMDLGSNFKSVVGGVGVFGKTIALKSVVRKFKIDKSQVVYVGDEVRDIKAAKKIRVPVISVTWGFNGKDILYNNNPDEMAVSPQELSDKIDKLIK